MSTWSIDPSMPTGLNYPGSCVDSLGRIYVVGGQDGATRKRANRYDPDTDSWTALPDMANIRYQHAVLCLSNDHVIAIAGNDGTNSLTTVEEYDPDTNTWTTIDPLPSPRDQFRACVVDDDIYVTGGRNTFVGGAGTYTNTLYRLREGSWTTLSPFTNARFDHAVASDGIYLVVAGGVDNTSFEHDTVERYDIVGDTWEEVDPLSVGRRSMGWVYDDFEGILYLIGGQAGAAYTDICETVDLVAGTNTIIASLSAPRTQAPTVMDLQGRIIVAGGQNSVGLGYLDTAERYDPEVDSWEVLDDLVYAHVLHGGQYTNQRCHLFGGAAVDLSDFDPIITDGTFAQSISLPSTARSGGGGGGPQDPYVPSTGDTLAGVGFIPLTNILSEAPAPPPEEGFDGYPGEGVYPGEDLFPMDP